MDVELGEQEAPVGDEGATMTVAAVASTSDAGGPDAAAGSAFSSSGASKGARTGPVHPLIADSAKISSAKVGR